MTDHYDIASTIDTLNELYIVETEHWPAVYSPADGSVWEPHRDIRMMLGEGLASEAGPYADMLVLSMAEHDNAGNDGGFGDWRLVGRQEGLALSDQVAETERKRTKARLKAEGAIK